MSEVETIPESLTQWPEPPRLLVEWSSRWAEFKSAFGPALTRPPKALAGEAPVGMFPFRGMLICWLLELLLLIAGVVRILNVRGKQSREIRQRSVVDHFDLCRGEICHGRDELVKRFKYGKLQAESFQSRLE